jgi:hypothetical protein
LFGPLQPIERLKRTEKGGDVNRYSGAKKAPAVFFGAAPDRPYGNSNGPWNQAHYVIHLLDDFKNILANHILAPLGH